MIFPVFQREKCINYFCMIPKFCTRILMLLMMNLDSTVWVCGGNWGVGRRAKGQLINAQKLRRIKQRKGNPQQGVFFSQ